MQKVCNIAKGLFAAAALIFLFAKNEILEKTAEGGTTGKVYGRVKRRIAVICVATFLASYVRIWPIRTTRWAPFRQLPTP